MCVNDLPRVAVRQWSVTRCNLSFGTRGFRIQRLLPSGIVSQLTSVLLQLSQHSATAFKITPLSVQFPHCLATHLSASDSLRPWRYTNLLTDLLTYLLIASPAPCTLRHGAAHAPSRHLQSATTAVHTHSRCTATFTLWCHHLLNTDKVRWPL